MTGAIQRRCLNCIGIIPRWRWKLPRLFRPFMKGKAIASKWIETARVRRLKNTKECMNLWIAQQEVRLQS